MVDRNTKQPRRKRVDWEIIEPHYRAGVRSLKDIGEEFDVSDAAIIKHARKHGWERNLKDRIRARAQAKVIAASVSELVSEEKKLTQDTRVDVESEVQSRITLKHRKDIPQKSELVSKLFAEISGMTDGADLFKTLEEALASGDEEGMAKVVRKVASLPQRIKGTTDLMNAYKTLIGLERQAFGIDDSSAPDSDGGYIIVPAKRVAHE